MPAQIHVEHAGGDTYRVTVVTGGTRTAHTVEVDPADHQRLTGGAVPPEILVRRSFEFLLEREPAESILPAFTLAVIRRYFPEYEHEIGRRVRAGS